MLHQQMRLTFGLLALACLAQRSLGQVDVNVPMQFTGIDEQRTLIGLAAPVQSDAMITVEGAVRSEWAWAAAVEQADTLVLSFSPSLASVRDGLLLRFLAPTAIRGPMWLRVPGTTPLALVRIDELPITEGQIVAGQVCEVLHVNGLFHLLNTADRGCPSGYLQVNANYCIESYSSNPLNFYDSIDQCALKGGKLCTWDEYQAACQLLDGQFENMFASWEWIDDTSNHLHTANQAGRTSCEGNRSLIVTVTARVRCCHHLR